MGKAITPLQNRPLAAQIVELYGLARRTEFTFASHPIARITEKREEKIRKAGLEPTNRVYSV